MKSKILIPMMAFVFAIGMSFTTEKPQATVWADMGGGNAQAVIASDCGEPIPEEQCYGQFEGDPAEYPLFHDQQLKQPLEGKGDVIEITL